MANHYNWGDAPALIEDHSIAKHELIQAYLERYVETLTSNRRMDRFRLTLVDGFSGGGLYEDRRGNQHLGSPLRMIEAMRIARAKRKSLVKKPFRLEVEYHFIDSDPEAIRALKRSISEGAVSPHPEEDIIEFHTSPFEKVVDKLVDRVKKKDRAHRVLFLLDQYGYTDVHPRQIRAIMQKLNNPEVLFTFFADHLLDYLSGDGKQSADKAAAHIGLNVEALMEKRVGREARKLVQMALTQQLRRRCGAPYFTPFFVRSRAAHRDYWLVHLAKHHRAHDVMLQQHWDIQNAYLFQHEGGGGLKMLGYDPRFNPQEPTMFCFDEDAGRLTHQKLLEQLPERLAATGPITFGDLYQRIANETPADAGRLRNALAELSRNREVEIEGHRAGTPPADSDILTLPRQVLLDFGR